MMTNLIVLQNILQEYSMSVKSILNEFILKYVTDASCCFFSQAGLIRTDNGEFFIEPLQKGQKESEVQGRVHVVYPRSAVKQHNQEDLHNEGEETENMEYWSEFQPNLGC